MVTLLAKNIRHLLAKTGTRPVKLARAAGVSPSTVSDWLSGTTKTMEGDNLIKVANFFGVMPADLIEMDLAADGVAEPAPRYGSTPMRFERVPVAGAARLGDDGFYDTMQDDLGGGGGFVLFPTRDRNAYALRIQGDSMRPRFKPGEYVVIDTTRAAEPGQEVVVKTIDGRMMVKVFDWRRLGLVQLSNVNEAHRPITLDESSIILMHRVVGLVQADLHTL